MATPRRLWFGQARWRLVVGVLVAVVILGVVTAVAVRGLDQVQSAHAAVEDIDVAQRDFQDADMAHDAVRAAAADVVLQREGRLEPGGYDDALRASIADFRDELRQVDGARLPPQLVRRVQEVRPLQDRYLDTAGQLLDTTDLAQSLAVYARVQAAADALVPVQDGVTRSLDEQAEQLRRAAVAEEHDVRMQVLASGSGALVVLAGLAVLLARMGRRLTDLLARERGVVETLQHSLLPDRLPELPGVRFAARYAPGSVGTAVGGDWYDVVPLPGGRVGLVMGDVVGHDLHAAASMGQLRNALRACADDGAPPAEVLHRLNRLCVSQELGDMASVLYAVLDPVQGFVDVSSAGHPPPLLLTPDESCYLEVPPSPPVGVVREAAFRSATWSVPPGSLLLLYTDGLVEVRGAALEPRLARLQVVLEAARAAPLEDLCDELLRSMGTGSTSEDDVALLLVAPQAALGPHVEVTWPAKAERLALLRTLLERWLAEMGADEEELYDVLVASSEAATNAVEHAYGPAQADFRVACTAEGSGVTVVVRDWGQWREPRGRDRGRGLGLMEGLVDEVHVSHSASGTEVRLHRRLRHPRPASDGSHEPATP